MGKSNAKIYVQSSEGIRFSDVAGEDEAKENLSEIVDYLDVYKRQQLMEFQGRLSDCMELPTNFTRDVIMKAPTSVSYTHLDVYKRQALTTLERDWWGEGEVKFYIDGDEEYPTICGTGTEMCIRDRFWPMMQTIPLNSFK